jgi:hypothetical protein
MQVDYYTYKEEYFTCRKCVGKGKEINYLMGISMK